LAEVIELLRGVRPLDEEESTRWAKALGVEAAKKKRGWF